MSIVLDWPALNTLAWLRLPCCDQEHPTHVEDFNNNDCVIAVPSLPHDRPVSPDTVTGGFFLGWVNGRAALEVPVDLVDTANEPVPTWTLTAVGPGVETQRRSYVRLSIDQTLHLYLLEGGAPTDAQLLDISEGGVRCTVDNWAIDPGEKLFTTRVTLEEREYYLRSQVAWRGTSDERGNRELGIRFVDMEPNVADSIRSYIFKTQVAQRRRSMA